MIIYFSCKCLYSVIIYGIAQYSLHYYSCDFWFKAHQQRARPTQQPVLHRLAGLSCDEIWLAPVAEQVDRVQALYTEEFAMILADLRILPNTGPILVEGAALLPALLLPYLAAQWRAIWLTPMPASQWINEQTAALGLRLVRVDGKLSIDETTALVARWLRLD